MGKAHAVARLFTRSVTTHARPKRQLMQPTGLTHAMAGATPKWRPLIRSNELVSTQIAASCVLWSGCPSATLSSIQIIRSCIITVIRLDNDGRRDGERRVVLICCRRLTRAVVDETFTRLMISLHRLLGASPKWKRSTVNIRPGGKRSREKENLGDGWLEPTLTASVTTVSSSGHFKRRSKKKKGSRSLTINQFWSIGGRV